jgi:hypothetical protein
MRHRGIKHRYPDRPTQRFRTRPRGPCISRSELLKSRVFGHAADKLLRPDAHGFLVAA